MNGGYQVFDLQGANITSSGVKIEGLYEFLKGRKKTVILENLVIDNIEHGSVNCGLTVSGSNIEVYTINGLTILIDPDDNVSKLG